MAFYLACVGLAETDDANAVRLFREAQYMQPLGQQADGNEARFSVVPSLIHGVYSRLEDEVNS